MLKYMTACEKNIYYNQLNIRYLKIQERMNNLPSTNLINEVLNN